MLVSGSVVYGRWFETLILIYRMCRKGSPKRLGRFRIISKSRTKLRKYSWPLEVLNVFSSSVKSFVCSSLDGTHVQAQPCIIRSFKKCKNSTEKTACSLEDTRDPQPTVYEGFPFNWEGDVWHMLQGYAGVLLDMGNGRVTL